MRRHVDTTGVVLVALAAIGFCIGGPLARVAGEIGFNGTTFAFWRSVGSVAALAVMLAIGVAIGKAPRVPLRGIRRFEWLQLVAMGLFVAGTTLGLFLGYERTTIALTLIVFYTYPIIVAVSAVPIYGEPLGVRRLAAILLASFGMVLRGSQYIGDTTLSAVEEFAAGAVGEDPGGYRAEFVELVRRARQLRPR